MPAVPCSACGREVDIDPGDTVECPGCAAEVSLPRARRDSKRRRPFDASKDINRMWCAECNAEVTASRVNEERFSTVIGLGSVISFAIGAGVAWPFLARGADWELVAILFVLYLGIAIYVCAMIADAVSRGKVFRCKTCESETEILS